MFRTARKAGNDLASNLNTHTFPQVLPQIRVQQKDIFRAHAEKKKIKYIQNRQIHLHNIHGTYLPSISYQFRVCPDDDQQTTPTPATACFTQEHKRFRCHTTRLLSFSGGWRTPELILNTPQSFIIM